MNPLLKIVGWLKGNDCGKLIKYTTNQITITGAKSEIGNFELGQFKNKIIELNKASELAVNLDNTQVMLCKEIEKIDANSPLNEECRRIRLQIILGFDQLQNILGTTKGQPEMDLKKELKQWIRFMSDLHKSGIKTLQGKPPGKGKSAVKLANVMQYQNINEEQIQEAVNKM